ncbi:MAG: hemC [candidate division NC10 bacterium]|nr:hemC [candidate division NC10 bacterium]
MNLEPPTLVIGTRGSQLAVWQAEHVAARLGEVFPGVSVRLERIRTTGDRILDVPLAQVGGKALFVKEIEEALLAGRVDLAVHSMKDVPTDLPAGLTIAAIPPREDPADVLISRTGQRLADLPRGARVGTSSLRRQAQLLHHRADLIIVGLRGNLDTRIRKLATEGLDAIVLAAAGVKRLGLERLVTEVLAPEIVVSASGQGALGIEIRESQGGRESREAHVTELVKALDHADTHTAVRAERAMLRRLGGGCQVPIAAFASVEGDTIRLRGLIASTDGATLVRGERQGASDQPETVGQALAEDLLGRGGQAILKAITGGNVRG